MRSAFVFVALAAVAAAQSAQQGIPGIPQCAQTCLEQAIGSSGCDPRDIACQCTPEKQGSIGAAAAPCLLKACNQTELVAAQQGGAAICANLSKGAASGTAAPTGTATGGPPGVETGSVVQMPTEIYPVSGYPTGTAPAAPTMSHGTGTGVNPTAPTATRPIAAGATGGVNVAVGLLAGAAALVAAL